MEKQVIDTRVFQRLRNVKQLGLTYLVFPDADYSRFAHSVGVCHLTSQILESLKKNHNGTDTKPLRLSPKEIQNYRLAGLLHDIGHFPFSHVIEEVIQDLFSAKFIELKDGSESKVALEDAQPSSHGEMGKLLICSDPELKRIFSDEKNKINPRDIYSIFLSEKSRKSKLINIISSDMDADRMDYLLRTSHAINLPYGSVDLPYILSQLCVDNNNQVCITPKALRPAEHFLLCRYFDYLRVAFNKTTKGLEAVLKKVVRYLFQENLLDEFKAILDEFSNGNSGEKWYRFDDQFILQKIGELHDKTDDLVVKTETEAVLRRKPPSMVANEEFIGKQRGKSAHKRLKRFEKVIKEKIGEWAEKFGIDEGLWYVWKNPGKTLAFLGTHPLSESEDQQAVHIFDKSSGKSEPIMHDERSLMKLLADNALYGIRVYVLLGDKGDRRKEIREHIREELVLD